MRPPFPSAMAEIEPRELLGLRLGSGGSLGACLNPSPPGNKKLSPPTPVNPLHT